MADRKLGKDPYAMFVQVVLHELYHILDATESTVSNSNSMEENARIFAYDYFKLL